MSDGDWLTEKGEAVGVSSSWRCSPLSKASSSCELIELLS